MTNWTTPPKLEPICDRAPRGHPHQGAPRGELSVWPREALTLKIPQKKPWEATEDDPHVVLRDHTLYELLSVFSILLDQETFETARSPTDVIPNGRDNVSLMDALGHTARAQKIRHRHEKNDKNEPKTNASRAQERYRWRQIRIWRHNTRWHQISKHENQESWFRKYIHP